MSGKKTRNAADTRRKILDAAEAEFAAKGFDGARLGSIARAVGVQQALIHHYFDDKAGLYHEVIDRALGAITTEGWDILARTVSSLRPRARAGRKGGRAADPPGEETRGKLTRREMRPLLDAFVEMLQRFFAEHGQILAIVRHEAGEHRTTSVGMDVVRTRVKPVVDGVVAYLEALQGGGELRADVDVRHLCVFALGSVAFPFLEAPLMTTVWPMNVRDADFRDAARREIVETLLSRLLP